MAAEFQQVGNFILEVLKGLADNGSDNNKDTEERVKKGVVNLCGRFPIY